MADSVNVESSILSVDFVEKWKGCPKCGTGSARHSIGIRNIRTLGNVGPTVIRARFSKHFCPQCSRYFSVPMESLAPVGSRYSNQVHAKAREMLKGGLTLIRVAKNLLDQYHVRVPIATLHDWESEKGLHPFNGGRGPVCRLST